MHVIMLLRSSASLEDRMWMEGQVKPLMFAGWIVAHGGQIPAAQSFEYMNQILPMFFETAHTHVKVMM